MSPPGPTTCVCVSSYASTVPVSRVIARSASWNPGSGSSSPTLFVSAGSVITIATSRGSRAGPQRLGVVELHDLRSWRDVARQAGLLRHELAVLQVDERLVEVPVVLAVEEQDLVAAGERPRDADRLGVRVRRAQRELPLRQAVAAAELLGDPQRVLVRQQELRALRRAARDRLHDRLRRVAAEHRHVRDVEVRVLVSVGVAEARALAFGDEQRRVVVGRAEPRHRHAVRHRGLRARPQLRGTRTRGDERRVLAVLDALDPFAVDVAGGGHGGLHHARGRSRTMSQLIRRSPSTTSVSRVCFTFRNPAFSYARCARRCRRGSATRSRSPRASKRCRASKATAREPIPRSISRARR